MAIHTHVHTHTPQAMGTVMFGFGIFVIVDLNQYGFFTETYYIAGAVVFILVGVAKMAFSVIGVIGMFGKWRWVLTVVSGTCLPATITFHSLPPVLMFCGQLWYSVGSHESLGCNCSWIL